MSKKGILRHLRVRERIFGERALSSKNNTLRWCIWLVSYLLLVEIMTFSSGSGMPERWKQGDIAGESVYALCDFRAPDPIKTIEAGAAASAAVPPVYYLDETVEKEAATEVNNFFTCGKSKYISAAKGRLLLSEKSKEKNVKSAVLALLRAIFRDGILSKADLDKLGKDAQITVREKDKTTAGYIEHKTKIEKVIEENIEERTDKLLENAQYGSRLKNYITGFVSALSKPNLRFDGEETDKRKDAAQSRVGILYRDIKKGRVIVRQGEEITGEAISALNAMAAAKTREERGFSTAGLCILVFILFAAFLVYLKNYRVEIYYNCKNLSILPISIVGISLISRFALSLPLPGNLVYLAPIAGASILIAILLGGVVAFIATLMLSMFVAVMGNGGLEGMFAGLLGGASGIVFASHIKHRMDFIKVSGLVGFANVCAVSCFAFLGFDVASGFSLSAYGTDVLLGLAGGVGSAIIAAALLPIFERLFGFATSIKLLELADRDQPLLRRLGTDAPGTYQSSLAVGNLAESAARDISAKPLLARVGAYYHDIGKLKNPGYFIENQAYGSKAEDGKHENLNPSMSNLILISHVKDGVELAYENRLPQPIIEIIRQHHGNSLTPFFYKHKGADAQEEDFRYPCPRPRTKESALVLLADSIEAASRDLKHPTAKSIRNLVRRIVDEKLLDGQLNECPLNLRDLDMAVESFIRTLISSFHRRISYPSEKEKTEYDSRSEKSSEEDKNKKKNSPKSR